MSYDNSIGEIYLHNYLHLAGISIFYFDYTLTFGDEYTCIWRRPKSVASWLFFLNRYLTFFGDIAVNVGNFYDFKSAASCDHYALYRQILLIGAQVVVCVILCLRIYALYRQDIRILVFVIGTGVTLMSLAIFSVSGQSNGTALVAGCHLAETRLTGIRVAVAWEALFLYDLLIFFLTIYKTWKDRHLYSLTREMPSLITLILRDGSIYFVVMAVVNLANTLTFYFLQPLLRGVLSTLASSVSVTMMSRLMLNLHESASTHPTLVSDPSSSDNSTTLLFTSRIVMDPHAEEETIYSPDIEEFPIYDGPQEVEMQNTNFRRRLGD